MLDAAGLEVDARGNLVRAIAELRDAIATQQMGASPAGAGEGYVSFHGRFTLDPRSRGSLLELTDRGRHDLNNARTVANLEAFLREQRGRADAGAGFGVVPPNAGSDS